MPKEKQQLLSEIQLSGRPSLDALIWSFLPSCELLRRAEEAEEVKDEDFIKLFQEGSLKQAILTTVHPQQFFRYRNDTFKVAHQSVIRAIYPNFAMVEQVLEISASNDGQGQGVIQQELAEQKTSQDKGSLLAEMKQLLETAEYFWKSVKDSSLGYAWFSMSCHFRFAKTHGRFSNRKIWQLSGEEIRKEVTAYATEFDEGEQKQAGINKTFLEDAPISIVLEFLPQSITQQKAILPSTISEVVQYILSHNLPAWRKVALFNGMLKAAEQAHKDIEWAKTLLDSGLAEVCLSHFTVSWERLKIKLRKYKEIRDMRIEIIEEAIDTCSIWPDIQGLNTATLYAEFRQHQEMITKDCEYFPNDLNVICLRIFAGSNLDLLDNILGDTALMKEGRSGGLGARMEVVQALILSGMVFLDLQNHSGQTALIVASEGGQLKVVQSLIGAGAALDVQDNNGRTALMEAGSWRNAEVLDVLIGADAALDVQDNNGRTALTEAAIRNCIETVQSLIGAGAALDVQDNDGRTALMEAAIHNYIEIVQALIAAGARLDIQDKDAQTALTIADNKGHQEIVDVLTAAANARLKAQQGSQVVVEEVTVKPVKDEGSQRLLLIRQVGAVFGVIGLSALVGGVIPATIPAAAKELSGLADLLDMSIPVTGIVLAVSVAVVFMFIAATVHHYRNGQDQDSAPCFSMELTA